MLEHCLGYQPGRFGSALPRHQQADAAGCGEAHRAAAVVLLWIRQASLSCRAPLYLAHLPLYFLKTPTKPENIPHTVMLD